MQSQPFSAAEIAPYQISRTSVSGLGDIKLFASYQGFLPTHNFGLQAGVKLPTGQYGGETDDGAVVGHPVFFKSGPLARQSLDTSLQAGTGSTDLIVGAYYFHPIKQNFDTYVNGQFQAAVSERLDTPGAEYRPGNQATVTAGLRYEAHANWVPQLQLNLLHKSANQGALADRSNTTGTVAYLSPGISASIRHNLQVYGFLQVPVYSHFVVTVVPSRQRRIGPSSNPLTVVANRGAPVKSAGDSVTSSAKLVPDSTVDWPLLCNAHVGLFQAPSATAAPPSASPCTKRRRAKSIAGNIGGD